MSEGKVRVIIKRPDEEFGHVTNISPSLKNLQRTVGGYIEMVTLAHMSDTKNLVVICDEEGRFDGAKRNFHMDDIRETIFGPVLFVGVKGEEFCDLPDEEAARIRKLFEEV